MILLLVGTILVPASTALGAAWYIYKNGTVASGTWVYSAQGPIEGGYIHGHQCGICNIYIKTIKTYAGTYASAAGLYEVYLYHPRVGPAKSACRWFDQPGYGSITIKCAYRA